MGLWPRIPANTEYDFGAALVSDSFDAVFVTQGLEQSSGTQSFWERPERI
jgi:hypothetical protein